METWSGRPSEKVADASPGRLPYKDLSKDEEKEEEVLSLHYY